MPYLIVTADGYIRAWERNAPNEPYDPTTETRVESDDATPPDRATMRWDVRAKGYRAATARELPPPPPDLRAEIEQARDLATLKLAILKALHL